jgi:hypothetical protein
MVRHYRFPFLGRLGWACSCNVKAVFNTMCGVVGIGLNAPALKQSVFVTSL